MLYESQHFRLEADDRVLTLWIDFRGRRTHTFTLPILHELNLILDRVAALPAPDVFLMRSGRPGVFLEEFDSAELARFRSPLEFAALARRGQQAGCKIARLPFPTVALIEGRCAGAGLELALACDYRWAVNTPECRFEFAEADRGLVPCWGGTVRLARLVGVRRAFRLLAGGEVTAYAARRHGFIDEVIPPAESAVGLLTLTDQLRDRAGRRPRSVWSAVRRAGARLWGSAWLRTRGDGASESSVGAELRRVVAAGLGSEGEGLVAERVAFTRLATGDTAKHRLDLHSRATVQVEMIPEPRNPIPRSPRRVILVGGGSLGSRLACHLARLELEVIIQEENTSSAARATRRVADRFTEQCRRGEIDSGEARRLTDAVRVTTGWVGVENADLAIEAVAEDAGVKRNVFVELERRVRPRVPLVTTSTTIPVEAVQAEAGRPGRIAGLHLPNLDAGHPIAELAGTPLTDSGTLVALGQWIRGWGFVPVLVADRPGRLVELVKLAYLADGVALVAEGLPIGEIDAGCRQFGMSRGPLEWCDDIGLDRLAESAAQIQLARGDRFARNLLFQRLLPHGSLGRDVGEGFYRYGIVRRPSETTRMILWQDLDEDGRAPYVFDPDSATREGIERIILRTVNEAAAALSDEPDSDPRTVDVALAFGMGWAPSRGGPLRHADTVGLPTVVERLASFAERFGSRYTPCDELIRRAEAGETFYGGPAAECAVPVIAWRAAG
jgi:3-hydroxyacyl-CoA dehydrogenase/enoyl-CoA hydratase/3-hydroxybutyryl-CoA epimerase